MASPYQRVIALCGETLHFADFAACVQQYTKETGLYVRKRDGLDDSPHGNITENTYLSRLAVVARADISALVHLPGLSEWNERVLSPTTCKQTSHGSLVNNYRMDR